MVMATGPTNLMSRNTRYIKESLADLIFRPACVLKNSPVFRTYEYHDRCTGVMGSPNNPRKGIYQAVGFIMSMISHRMGGFCGKNGNCACPFRNPDFFPLRGPDTGLSLRQAIGNTTGMGECGLIKRTWNTSNRVPYNQI
jgi:hypothetical protein